LQIRRNKSSQDFLCGRKPIVSGVGGLKILIFYCGGLQIRRNRIRVKIPLRQKTHCIGCWRIKNPHILLRRIANPPQQIESKLPLRQKTYCIESWRIKNPHILLRRIANPPQQVANPPQQVPSTKKGKQ